MSADSLTPPARSTPGKSRRRPIPPGLFRRAAAARFCSAGVSTWDRWTAAGLTPTAIRISGAVYWSRAELAEWCRHGCPPRAEWEHVWSAIVARRTGRAK